MFIAYNTIHFLIATKINELKIRAIKSLFVNLYRK